ncbi:hypothetical protein [Streptomyces sp. NPDC057616]|uniref:hypothetical protein n=1 Tax=Streptomyces sp. NPDC057616 TaxID=3346183 RepID=UPI00368F054B
MACAVLRRAGRGQDRARLLPLFEVTATGHGRTGFGERFIDSTVSARLAHLAQTSRTRLRFVGEVTTPASARSR